MLSAQGGASTFWGRAGPGQHVRLGGQARSGRPFRTEGGAGPPLSLLGVTAGAGVCILGADEPE